MSSLEGQSSARMASNLCYDMVHTYTLMVASTNWEGLQVLVKQNNIVPYEKATLEDRSERLEDQVSSLTQEKDELENRLARCQRLLRAWILSVRSRVFVRHVRPLDLKRGNNWVVGLQVSENLKSQILALCTRKAEEVDAALLSLTEMDFLGLFHLGKLDYDSFRQFCGRSNPGGSFKL
ncbi:unnamed protein product [Lactuca saligna]|uniref:Uncharacterized protein n=1 Tax=Lactuca saligna TaxID=75948 RepID=A0AA35VGK7_LACSI|nr:unnamed protein product [Lactuca saligna]